MPEHDVIDEARNRHEYELREAFGVIDGQKVYVATDLKKHGTPYVTALFGGDWYHYQEDDIEDEFVGATSFQKKFDKAHRAVWYFEEVVEEHGLDDSLPDEWAEEAGAHG